ncbi:Sodium/hydrogen exchanger family-domain-containing protein [Pilobolus umbonatus]|nr:Sodium/hydrogen exchanger family-domain-containing protein [Pilobolus umbonatus]
MSDIASIVAAIIGGLIIFYGLTSLFIKEKLYLSEASGLINVDDWGDKELITKEFTRFVLGIQVMAAGVSLPAAYLKTEWKSVIMLYLPVMTFMWITSGLLVWALIPGLDFIESLMIAACFTPTDPILSNSIIHGKFAEKHVPEHVRNLISCDSGVNDGLGAPFLFLAIYLMQMDTGAAIGKFAYWMLGYNIILSAIIGFVIGFASQKLLRFSVERKLIDKESYLVFAIALALLIMGLVGLMRSDDLLACFITGNALTWDDWFRVETEKAHLMEVVDMLPNISIFVYIGATMPWSHFNNPEIQLTLWRLVVLAVLVLLFRRMPIMMALYKWIPAIHNWQEAIFTGWFGPTGVGCIFYYAVALESLPVDGPNAHARALIGPVAYFIVFSSIVVHGITIPVFYLGSFASKTLTQTNILHHHHFHIPKIHIHHAHHHHHEKDSYSNDSSDIVITNGNPCIEESICRDKTCAMGSMKDISTPQLIPCTLPCTIYNNDPNLSNMISSHCSLALSKDIKEESCCDLGALKSTYQPDNNRNSSGCIVFDVDDKKRLSGAYYLPK